MTGPRRLIFGMLLIGIVAAGCTSTVTLNGVTRTTPLNVSAVSLRDVTDPAVRAGGSVSADGLSCVAAEGRCVAGYVGFLNCPDICPTTLMDLRVALERVDTAVAQVVDVAFVTVDPSRDTPDALMTYLAYFFPRFHALRDETDALQATLDAFLASAELQFDASGEVIDVAHTAVLYLVNDQGDVVVEWPFGTRPQAIADDLAVLVSTALADAR